MHETTKLPIMFSHYIRVSNTEIMINTLDKAREAYICILSHYI